MASSRESSKKDLTAPQLWAPFCKQRNISSQISLFLACSHVDTFLCYAPEGHGSTKGVGHARQWGLGWISGCTHLLSFFLWAVCPHSTVPPTFVEHLSKEAVLGLG